jgi:hypothetical protein
MAQWHLDELREALHRRGWRLTEEMPGDDYRISASWALERSGQQPARMVIDFEGLDDMNTLPISESYACSVRGSTNSLYFRRRGETESQSRARWQSELADFVAGVDVHAI